MFVFWICSHPNDKHPAELLHFANSRVKRNKVFVLTFLFVFVCEMCTSAKGICFLDLQSSKRQTPCGVALFCKSSGKEEFLVFCVCEMCLRFFRVFVSRNQGVLPFNRVFGLAYAASLVGFVNKAIESDVRV